MVDSTARCGEHPDRAAEAPCTRCGAFRCDWCVKLAPSWGPGLCASCQKRQAVDPAAKLPRSRLFMFVSFGVLLGPFFTGAELKGVLALREEETVVQSVVMAIAAVLVVLLVWNVAAILLVALRNPRARAVLLGYFAVRFVVSLLFVLVNGDPSFRVWWPVPIQALLFAYVGWSAEANAFLRPQQSKTAAELLADDEGS
jgi:hypothetical protein